MGTATILVQFGEGGGSTASGHLSAEIDSRADGLNAGKTAFAPGDTVAILVYRSSNADVTAMTSSAGSVSGLASNEAQTVTVNITEDLQFANSDTVTLKVPASNTPTTTWIGRSLGNVTLQSDGMTLKSASRGVAVARMSYQASGRVFQLTSPSAVNGSADFPILVVITGRTT